MIHICSLHKHFHLPPTQCAYVVIIMLLYSDLCVYVLYTCTLLLCSSIIMGILMLYKLVLKFKCELGIVIVNYCIKICAKLYEVK